MKDNPSKDDADAMISGLPRLEGLEFSEPAEILVELARRGELDPWDVDIGRTTDRFLEFVDSLERRDLRIPARTLLYASILLRMKSDSMEEIQEESLPQDEPEEAQKPDLSQVEGLPTPPIRRRTKRPVTLDELITELKKAEMVGRRRAMREKWPETPAEKKLDLSHEEGIEEVIAALGPVLDDMFTLHEKIPFNEIQTGESVMNYISLLFMAHRRQVWLEQEEIFGELYLRRHPG